MKLILTVFIFLSFSCNQASSPDGRSRQRDQVLQAEVNSLKIKTKPFSTVLLILTKL